MGGGYESQADGKLALVGVRIDTGETRWVDVTRYGQSHVRFMKGVDGNIYIYTGNPSHFLKYDITRREVTDLGVPASP